MEDNKDVRKHEHSHEHSDESCSSESWQYGGEMCCPYIYCCPMMPQMKPYKNECKGHRGDEGEADDENMMREPMYHGGHDHHDYDHHDYDHHDYGHHYGHYYHHYPYYPYYPYYYYPPYPYYRPRPWY